MPVNLSEIYHCDQCRLCGCVAVPCRGADCHCRAKHPEAHAGRRVREDPTGEDGVWVSEIMRGRMADLYPDPATALDLEAGTIGRRPIEWTFIPFRGDAEDAGPVASVTVDDGEDQDPELIAREREQCLAVLKGARARRRDLDESEYLLIKAARDGGLTWREIAGAIGDNSPQRAQQRFDRLAVVLARARAGSWWIVDHHAGDGELYAYCRDCYRQIPGFLVRSADEIDPPYLVCGKPAQCQGCGKTARAEMPESNVNGA